MTVDRKAFLDRQEPRAGPDLRDLLALLVKLDHMAHLVVLELRDLVEKQDLWDNPAQTV